MKKEKEMRLRASKVLGLLAVMQSRLALEVGSKTQSKIIILREVGEFPFVL